MGNDDMFRELCVRVEPGKGEEFIMAYYNEFDSVSKSV